MNHQLASQAEPYKLIPRMSLGATKLPVPYCFGPFRGKGFGELTIPTRTQPP